jgi:hypothetical protein
MSWLLFHMWCSAESISGRAGSGDWDFWRSLAGMMIFETTSQSKPQKYEVSGESSVCGIISSMSGCPETPMTGTKLHLGPICCGSFGAIVHYLLFVEGETKFPV